MNHPVFAAVTFIVPVLKAESFRPGLRQLRICFFLLRHPHKKSAEAAERVRVISIARLWTSPSLHLRPIDVIVSDDPCVEILS